MPICMFTYPIYTFVWVLCDIFLGKTRIFLKEHLIFFLKLQITKNLKCLEIKTRSEVLVAEVKSLDFTLILGSGHF